MRLALVCAILAAVAGLLVPAASGATRVHTKARHLAGGLPFKPPTQGTPLPYTGIGLGGTALLGVLMLSGGLLVRRAAVARV